VRQEADAATHSGAITDLNAGNPAKPYVKLDGDTEAWPTHNHAVGYTPVVGHRVLVLVENGHRRHIARKVP
jgi:hypothetical protein